MKVFIATFTGYCINNGDNTTVLAKGPSLKAVHSAFKEQLSDHDYEFEDFEDEDIEFYEAEKFVVEFQIVRKEVITSVPKAAAPVKPVGPKKR